MQPQLYMFQILSCLLILYLTGRRLEMPILVAPMAMQCMADPVGESGVARATKELGGGMILSTMSTISLEEVAQAAGPDSFLMFQLYVRGGVWRWTA